jgi:hypothetical protein
VREVHPETTPTTLRGPGDRRGLIHERRERYYGRPLGADLGEEAKRDDRQDVASRTTDSGNAKVLGPQLDLEAC